MDDLFGTLILTLFFMLAAYLMFIIFVWITFNLFQQSLHTTIDMNGAEVSPIKENKEENNVTTAFFFFGPFPIILFGSTRKKIFFVISMIITLTLLGMWYLFIMNS